MVRCLLIAGLLACACKGKVTGHGKPTGKAGSGSAAYEAPPPPSRESAAAAKTRKALFDKLAKAETDAGSDCDKLGTALAAMLDEASAAHDAKDNLLDADRIADAKLETATMTSLYAAKGQCKDTSKVDSFVHTLVGGEPDGSASGSQR